jgi:hypothetical protein
LGKLCDLAKISLVSDFSPLSSVFCPLVWLAFALAFSNTQKVFQVLGLRLRFVKFFLAVLKRKRFALLIGSLWFFC